MARAFIHLRSSVIIIHYHLQIMGCLLEADFTGIECSERMLLIRYLNMKTNHERD